MKELAAGLAALCIVLIMAVGCNSSANDSSSSDGGYSTGGANSSVPVSNALVRQVRIGMTEQEVRDLLGEPKMFVPTGDPRMAVWLYDTDGGMETAVGFVDGKVNFLPWIDGKPQ